MAKTQKTDVEQMVPGAAPATPEPRFKHVQSNRQLPLPISRQATPVRVKLWPPR